MADRALPGAIASAWTPHGDEASRIAPLSDLLTIGAIAIFVVVMLLLALAIWRPRAWLASPRTIVAGGIVFPVVVLTALLVFGFRTSPTRALDGAADLVVDVIGQQWWWRLRYRDADGAIAFESANEIRVPVGAKVEYRLHSADVLHAFWVPALAGKLDMIPGRENRLRIVVERAGVYRGLCAEFCGTAHAHMGIVVVAMPPADYAAWDAAQRAPAIVDASSRGAQVFAERCAVCHVVRGTDARGTAGPDLTHLASRDAIAAAMLPRDRASLERWLIDGQHVKPGNLMPAFPDIGADDRAALLDYLDALR